MSEYVISLTLFENLVPGNEKRAFPSEVTCQTPSRRVSAALPASPRRSALTGQPGLLNTTRVPAVARGREVGEPRLGGLHHRYDRAA